MSTSHVWYVWFEANSHWYTHFCWGNLMKIPCPASSANNETLHAQFQELRQARKLFCGRGVLFFCDKGWWIELILHNSLFSDSHLFLPTYSAILGIAYSWEDFIMHVSFNHFLKCLLDFNICRKALSFTCCSLQFIQFFYSTRIINRAALKPTRIHQFLWRLVIEAGIDSAMCSWWGRKESSDRWRWWS